MPFRSNKPARLEKSRTNDNSGSTSSPARYDEVDDTGLRSPNRYSIQTLSHQQLVTRQRQQLLRQASDNSAPSKNGQDRLGRSTTKDIDQYADPKASSSTVNSIVNEFEARSRIDVEQAIGLLQELKKTASPDELVALHRALLPVKEDTPPPVSALPSIEQRAYTSVPPERRRSVIPPGLATRSSTSDDILRRLPDPPAAQTSSKWPQRETWLFDTPTQQARNDSPSRLSTRSEQAYCHAGAFASGTLRITNGAASPEPSIISKLALESNDVEEEQTLNPSATTVTTQSSYQTLYERRSEDAGSIRPKRMTVMDQQSSKSLRPSGPRPGYLDSHSRQQDKVGAELQLDLPLQRHSFQHVPDTASDDAPRFQQRWSHRAAFLSQEYALDCEITESPYEEEGGPVDFPKRLSTVHDDGESEIGQQDDANADMRADALSKLTGMAEEGTTGDDNEIGTAGTAERSLQLQSPAVTHARVLRKVDSGYGSDASASPLQRKSSAEAGKSRNTPAIHEQPSTSYRGTDPYALDSHLAADLRGSSNDTESLLTVEEMVISSPQIEAAWNTSPSQPTKKSPLSLFKSKSKVAGKSSFSVLNVHHGDRPKTSEGSDVADASPPPSRSGPGDKHVKKLQKPMPDSVRRQRKKTMEDLQATMSMPPPTVQNLLADETAKDGDSNCFVGCQPKEAAEDRESHQVPQISKEQTQSLLKHGKSFAGRKRSKTVGEAQEKFEMPSASSVPSRTRSKSIADHTAPIPVHADEDIVPSMNCLRSSESETPARDRPVPLHTDFASVAQALRSRPADLSSDTNRSAPVPRRSSMQRYYSLHKIDIPGQESHTADDQACKQKSDVETKVASSSVQGEASSTEQRPAPRPHSTAASTPADVPTLPVAVGSSYSVEDRFPGWQGKPASPNATPPQTPLHSPSSSISWLSLRHNRSESTLAAAIPPLPELPADIAAKVSRADQMVAKKMRLSPRSSPATSARNSFDSGDTRKQVLVRKAEARKEADEGRSNDARQAALDQLNVPIEQDENGTDRPAGDRQRWSVDGSIQLPRPEEPPLPASPTHDSQHPGWPGWEQQSNLWRQRREALARSLEIPEMAPNQEASEQTYDSPSTPGIIVSRYITPLGAENAQNANKIFETSSDSAKKFAQEYTSLIEDDDKENTPTRPTIPRADSVVSTATYVTMQSTDDRPVRMAEGSRPSSELSHYTTTTTVSSTTTWSNNSASSRSPFNRSRQQQMRAEPGRFTAYKPTDASHAERSRALNMAQTSTASVDNLAPPLQRPELKKSSSESLCDRFGGGMQYGWDRNSNSFGGSAGLRAGEGAAGDNRKSVKMSEEFGLDLSDIPVYLRRGETFSTAFHG